MKFGPLSVLEVKVKKVAHKPFTGLYMAAAHLGFCSTKQLGAFLCPSGRDASSL